MKIKSVFIILVIVIIVLSVVVVNNAKNDTLNSKVNNFSNKWDIKLLLNEMEKYSPAKSLSPKDVNDISINCNRIIFDLFSKRESVSFTSRVTSRTLYYLKISDTFSLDGKSFRFIEFGSKNKTIEGSSTNLYIQYWDRSRIWIQNISNITFSASSNGEYLYYNLSDDKKYICIFSRIDTIEDFYIRIDTYKLDQNNKWQDYQAIVNNFSMNNWELIKAEDTKSVDIYNNGNLQSDFEITINLSNSNYKISLLKNNDVQDEFSIKFSKGFFEETNPNQL